MALMLGHSIAGNCALDLTDVVSRYLAWYNKGAFDTGPVWNAVFKLIAAGVDPKDAARVVDARLDGRTAGANTAHRATAIGCASAIPDALVAAEARREAQLTHWHVDAAEASAATAVIIRAMLRGASLSDAVTTAAAATTVPPAEEFVRSSVVQEVEEVKVVEAKPSGGGWGWGGWFSAATSAVRRVTCDV